MKPQDASSSDSASRAKNGTGNSLEYDCCMGLGMGLSSSPDCFSIRELWVRRQLAPPICQPIRAMYTWTDWHLNEFNTS